LSAAKYYGNTCHQVEVGRGDGRSSNRYVCRFLPLASHRFRSFFSHIMSIHDWTRLLAIYSRRFLR
jgi:hypothetical protein